MAGGKHLLGMPRGRHVFGTVKVGERGQIVIPKRPASCSASGRATRCSCSAMRKTDCL